LLVDVPSFFLGVLNFAVISRNSLEFKLDITSI
jgi:hypothetical protein